MKQASRLRLIAGAALIGVLAIVAALSISHGRAEARLMRADPDFVLRNKDLSRTALSLGQRSYEAHCASCHNDGRADRIRGIPDLTDGDFLYGTGRVSEIEQIVLHGIRSGDSRGWNLASMPAYARRVPYDREPIPPLTPEGLRDVTEYLLAARGRSRDPAAAARGDALFKNAGGCWDCHGRDGGGDEAIGAPNLLDDVWLYGDETPRSIARSIAYGRAGASPAFVRTLRPVEARAVAVYVASLSSRGTPK